jgi:hypothetical protein
MNRRYSRYSTLKKRATQSSTILQRFVWSTKSTRWKKFTPMRGSRSATKDVMSSRIIRWSRACSFMSGRRARSYLITAVTICPTLGGEIAPYASLPSISRCSIIRVRRGRTSMRGWPWVFWIRQTPTALQQSPGWWELQP